MDKQNAPRAASEGSSSNPPDNSRLNKVGRSGGTFTPAHLFLLLGALSLAGYFQVAASANFFQAPSFDYIKNPVYLLGIPSELLSSMLWKILLLLPAAVFCGLSWAKLSRPLNGAKLLTHKAFLAVLILVVILGLLFTINVILQKTEVTDDELTYELQAKVLLSGHVYVAPPVEHSFDNVFVLRGEKFTGKYTLGHPAVLAVGMLLGSSYVMPAVFAALLVWLVYKITLIFYREKRTAALAALLLAVSPLFYFTSATRLSHPTSAVCLALFMVIFLEVEVEERPSVKALTLAFAAGLAAGYAANVRPLSALAFLVPFIFIVFSRDARQLAAKIPAYASMALGFIAVMVPTLVYNKAITGKPFEFPFVLYNPNEKLFGPWHHVPQVLMNLLNNAAKTNLFLFGFPLSLLFVFLLLFKAPKDRAERLCLGIVLSFAVFHLSYYSPGVSDTGPVYYFELLVPLVILSARGILWFADLLRRKFPEYRGFLAKLLVISVILAAASTGFERCLHLVGLTTAVQEPYKVIEAAGVHNAVVFIKSWPNKGFVYGFRNNSPKFDDDVVLCRLLPGDFNLKVVQHYPKRSYFVLAYDEQQAKTTLASVTAEELARF